MKIHLIGIGGIGVSALAQYYLSQGHEITGSDLVMSQTTEYLEKLGITINYKKISNFKLQISKLPQLVIYSPAVKKNNSEIKFYLAMGIKCLSYPEALGKLTKEYFTIAIAGAHGKSTTTAMLGLILMKARLDPTIIVGTKLKEFGGTNFRLGRSKYLVIEACEYDSSFLHYSPQIIVITNIDKEHLDYFKSLKNIIKAFKDFIFRLPKSGVLIKNGDDKNIDKISDSRSSIYNKLSIKQFSIKQKEADDLRKILKVPGNHNVYNALAAMTAAREFKIDDEIIFNALAEYRGSWRRFEERDKTIEGKKIKIIDDYGHHPNEVRATLEAAREKYPNRKIWCIFQPHQRQRTFNLFNDFVKTFQSVPIDNIIITDIYDVVGRETKKISNRISSKMLVKKIHKKNVFYLSMISAEKKIKKDIKTNDVLIIMGAGDIYEKFSSKF